MINKLLLLILDGFGWNEEEYGNAIAAAHTPCIDDFFHKHPPVLLQTCGNFVGLPSGAMGNSEVGHLNIGAGRIVYQLNTLIDKAIVDGSFFNNPCLQDSLEHALKNNGNVHLFGLISDGNVHSHIDHLQALLEYFRLHDFRRIYIHAFLDGRDTLPNSGLGFMKTLLDICQRKGIGQVATVSGRYYAMDRDNRWERIKKAYDAIVHGKGEYYNDALSAIRSSYEAGITDEFVVPRVIGHDDNPVTTVKDRDSIIFFNFRADRARQLTGSFILQDFNKFSHKKFTNLHFTSFSEYDVNFNPYLKVCFRLPVLNNILGEVIAQAGLRQLRLAETEKYAHVTFFFNGGVEKPFPGEERILVPSPQVLTYDLQPEMSADAVTDELITALQKRVYDFIVTNFANCDMVGHTGSFSATRTAVEAVDNCLERILQHAPQAGYNIVLTSDHGNADKMLDRGGNIFTAHSMNPVPFSLSLLESRCPRLHDGILADIAPTLLQIMGIPVPDEMTGQSLLVEE